MKKNHTSEKVSHEMPPLIKTMVANKKVIQAYLKGEITKEELTKQGIELAQPL
jgi:hypothetical protein